MGAAKRPRPVGYILTGVAILFAARAVIFVPEASACLPGFKPKPGITNPTDNARDCEPEGGSSSPPPPPGGAVAPPEPRRPPGPAIPDPSAQRKKVEERLKRPSSGEGGERSGEPSRPKAPPPGRGDGTDEAIRRLGEKLRKCRDCDYRITSIIDELKGLEIPAGFPKAEVDEVNFLSQAERAGMIRSFRDIQNAMGKLTAAIEIAGGLMTGGVAEAAIELMGFLFGEMFADPGQLFDDPDALARGLSRGITAIRIKVPVYVVNARFFSLRICEKGEWKPFKGLHFAWDGPKVLEFDAPLPGRGGAGTIADQNRMRREAATAFARQMYKSRVANAARLRAFLTRARDTTPSECKLRLSDSDFAGVPPEGAAPEPAAKAKNDCSAILAKIKEAEAERAMRQERLAALRGALTALTGTLAGLKGRLAEAQGTLRKTEADIRARRANAGSVDAMLASLQQKATGGGVLSADEIASLDRLAALQRRYRDEIEALEGARNAARAVVESVTAEIAGSEAAIESVRRAITGAEAEIAALAKTIAGLRAEYERCLAENR